MSVHEDLKAFIDDELTPERAAEVQAAIDQDPSLREEYLFMKQLSGDIKSAAKQPQVEGLEKAVAKTAGKGLGFKFNKWAAYGATGLAAVMLIGFVGTKIGNPLDGFNGRSKDVGQATLRDQARAGSPTTSDAIADKAIKGNATRGGSSPSADGFQNGTINQGMTGKGEFEKPLDGNAAGLDLNDQSRSGGKDAGGGGAFMAKKLDESKSPAPSYEHQTRTNDYGMSVNQPLDRKVIRTADMGLKVKDVGKAMEDTETQVSAMGGFVESQNFNQAEDSSQGTMNFQVPSKNFDAIVESLKRLGTVVKNNKTGQDVTGRIAYTDGQVHSLADEEDNLIKELQRTKNSTDRLEIRSQLSRVRQEMAGLKEENKQTKDLADMSRFVVRFEKSGQLDESRASDWFGQTTEGAGNVLGFFGRIFGVGIIYTVFLAPIWLPITGLVWWLRRRAKIQA